MTLEQYWSTIVKQWKIIVICFVSAGLTAYLVSRFTTPLYQSTALVQVEVKVGSSSQTDILASNQLVQTEVSLAVSDPVLRAVASSYPNLTVVALTKNVTSTATLNTQLFGITVQDPSPTRAASLANAIATTLIKQQEQIAEQENSQAQHQIEQNLASSMQQINDIANQIAALSTQPGKAAQMAILQSQLNTIQQQYTQWPVVLAQLELTQAQNGNFLRIAQSAQPALQPTSPNTPFNTAAGLAAGLFIGILLAVALAQLDTRVRTPEALSQFLGWSALATIWDTHPSDKEAAISPTQDDVNDEAYRILRTNIGFASPDEPLHSFMVTSALPFEGKSVIAMNLAIFMAKAGKNTLLIDADLRRPTLHAKFGLPANMKGLTNAVLSFMKRNTPNLFTHSESSLTLSIGHFMHSVNIPNLLVMPSGPLPPNPPELIDSKAMQRLLAAIAHYKFDTVIFDAPPLLGLSDARILTSKVEGTLVVVDINQAKKKNLKQAQALLTQAGANVLGCVINKQRYNPKDKDIAYSYYQTTTNKADGLSISILAKLSISILAKLSNKP